MSKILDSCETEIWVSPGPLFHPTKSRSDVAQSLSRSRTYALIRPRPMRSEKHSTLVQWYSAQPSGASYFRATARSNRVLVNSPRQHMQMHPDLFPVPNCRSNHFGVFFWVRVLTIFHLMRVRGDMMRGQGWARSLESKERSSAASLSCCLYGFGEWLVLNDFIRARSCPQKSHAGRDTFLWTVIAPFLVIVSFSFSSSSIRSTEAICRGEGVYPSPRFSM